MSSYLAVEKLTLAVVALVGPEDIRERLAKALGPLTTIRGSVVGKRAAFDDNDDLVTDYDRIMKFYDEVLASPRTEGAGVLTTMIFSLYERTR